MKIAIEGGRLYDPASGVDGEVRTIYIEDGRVVAGGGDFQADRTIDATGRVVFPGGVDMHCHIAGASVNRARRLTATSAALEPQRVSYPLTPSTTDTGLRYSRLGYTTAVEAAVAPTAARQCHLELADTPNLDRGFLLLLANNRLLLETLAAGEAELAAEIVACLLRRTAAFGIKAVNPGGVAHWKERAAGVDSFAGPIGGSGVSPRDIVQFLARVARDLGLPHPVHVHANRLGVPGNIDVTLETSRALEGCRHHLAHVQFHCYGQTDGGGFESGASRFVDHLHSHPEVSADVGQVMFGDALTLSADQEIEYSLWKLTGNPYVNLDIELETGCGMVPLEYRPRSRLHTLQWAVGLELFLLCEDPWRLALTTDHPNGGSFLAYPTLIAHLMDREKRREAMQKADARTLDACVLRDLSREYSLLEIATITRAAPARILGLERKGHLGVGADADVTIYDDNPDRETMFRWPGTVLSRGQTVVDGGELRETRSGETFRVAPVSVPRAAAHIERWVRDHGSYDSRQLGLDDEEAAMVRRVATGNGGET